MIVTTISRNTIHTTTLPQKVTGQYWLFEMTETGPQRLISVDGLQEAWILRSGRRVHAVDRDGNVMKNAALSPQTVTVLEKADGERVLVFAEPVTDDRLVFSKFIPSGDMDITIGRASHNDICFTSQVVSGEHAVLSCHGGIWSIADRGSTNGTFVNEERVSSAALAVGDCIFIMGLKIVIGKGFFAVNDPDGLVRVSERLQRFRHQVAAEIPEEEEWDAEPLQLPYFSRSPRFLQEVKTAKIKLDTPPQSPLAQELPWFLVIGSSLAMGMMSLITLISAIAAHNVTSMAMGGSMLLGTVLLPIITKRYEKSMKKKKEALRQTKYTAYLEQVRRQIAEESERQEQLLHKNHVTVEECADRVLEEKPQLWDRSARQNDFLTVRLGLGERELNADVQVPEKKFTLEEDNLEEALYKLADAPRRLKDVPITVSLKKCRTLGLVSASEAGGRLIRNLIVQLSAFYGYDEVKLVFLMDREQARGEFEFVRWLPHVWSDDRSLRMIATDHDEAKLLSAALEGFFTDRAAAGNERDDDPSPYYVIFDLAPETSRSAEFLKVLLKDRPGLGASVVSMAPTFQLLPKECSTVIELSGVESGRIFEKDVAPQDIVTFRLDAEASAPPMVLSKHLANVFLDTEDTKYVMPKMVTFLEMYGVGRIEHLNPDSRWKENDPTKSLNAPVGVDTSGRLFKLDLHEKFHGPHGLVAGMTGSGKSEFIITYILSMAVNYHPDEVAFILIDYKGGGLAGAFVDEDKGIRLPHVAGTITNLDGPSITRSLISIQSELRHRQAIFNEAKKVSNEGTMDIYKYQKLFRRGLVKEPLPHLFIISDEFAELKTQQPEFMEQLISAARIGRSLGVHLILATQKPSGVVDDQIWSNSRFRVCLKVQEKADSMDMIKRPDAAALAETGRFYLQVGFNEFFDMGQSAWCGAPYAPSERPVVEKDNSVRVIDTLGRTRTEVKPRNTHLTGNEVKQVVALVKYLSDIAEEENIHERQLWLPPIPAQIFVDQLEEKYGYQPEAYRLNPVLGEYDDPFNQEQHLLTLPLSDEGHTIVYGSTGSGTEELLGTLTYSILRHHSAEEVQLYIMDFGGETLGAFRAAPQVGDVIFSTDEEKVANLFKMLKSECASRRKAFAPYGGNYRAYVEKSGEKPHEIVVMINNYAAFSDLYENMEDDLASLTRECRKYGIYFVMTAAAGSAVRYRMQQNFSQMLVLQMNDPSDYVAILGQTEGITPSHLPGRGILRRGQVYEFQTARPEDAPDDMELYRSFAEKLSAEAEAAGLSARRVPVLPETVLPEHVEEELTGPEHLPVGLEKEQLGIVAIDVKSPVVYPFYAEKASSLIDFTASAASLLARTGADVTVVDPSGMLPDGPYDRITDDLDDFVITLFMDVLTRNNEYKDAGLDASVLEAYEEKYYVIFGMKALQDRLSEDALDKFKILLEKTESIYKLHFIVAEEVGQVRNYSFQGWFRRQVPGGDGVWVGNGLYDQYTLKLAQSKTTSETVGRDFGYVVSGGREQLVKLVRVPAEEEPAWGGEETVTEEEEEADV
ncbi:MAG: type VII secretion protein EssC [Lachnospiraceae bacterium]|nr:type VII secretion protein EssC [Lachnospiraceae bacterium]